MKVLLSGAGRLPPRWRRALTRAALAALGPSARKRAELCLVFVDDRRIRALNRRFLGRPSATDVIAFRYPDPLPRTPFPGGKEPLPPFGDVYVARGVAARQARALGHGLAEELLTLAVHGALHLAGHDDARVADKRRMFAVQDRLVRRFLPRDARTAA